MAEDKIKLENFTEAELKKAIKKLNNSGMLDEKIKLVGKDLETLIWNYCDAVDDLEEDGEDVSDFKSFMDQMYGINHDEDEDDDDDDDDDNIDDDDEDDDDDDDDDNNDDGDDDDDDDSDDDDDDDDDDSDDDDTDDDDDETEKEEDETVAKETKKKKAKKVEAEEKDTKKKASKKKASKKKVDKKEKKATPKKAEKKVGVPYRPRSVERNHPAVWNVKNLLNSISTTMALTSLPVNVGHLKNKGRTQSIGGLGYPAPL